MARRVRVCNRNETLPVPSRTTNGTISGDFSRRPITTNLHRPIYGLTSRIVIFCFRLLSASAVSMASEDKDRRHTVGIGMRFTGSQVICLRRRISNREMLLLLEH
ncbi:hypothetical protein F4811DRAFT_510105 [Daldinia bambusicola]|nr:hypothetical protein F4811DRAFT_510105 [Daldinia bambusicola]